MKVLGLDVSLVEDLPLVVSVRCPSFLVLFEHLAAPAIAVYAAAILVNSCMNAPVSGCNWCTLTPAVFR